MFLKTLVIALIALMVAGCAGGRFGVAPNGRMYGEVAVGPAGVQGYNHGQQQQIMIQQNQTVVMPQRGYRQPRFCANYYSNSSGCYGGNGGGQQLVQQCKVNRSTGQRICQMVPPHMVNQW